MTETPIYQMFDIIAQSGVGNLGNAGLIMLQLFISMYMEIKLLYAAMKNRPALVQVSVSMIPMVLIATYSIACGIIFSAFLGNGPNPYEMAELINVSLSRQSVLEMVFAAALFFVLMLLYSIVFKLKPSQWLMTFGVEILAASSLLVLYGGLLLDDFPYTILDLCNTDIYLARWPIYGYFTIMFKCFVLVFSLVLGLILHERPEKEDEEEKYRNRSAYYEKKTLRYITKGNVIIAVSFLIFSGASESLFLWRMFDEGIDNLDSIFTAVLFSILFLSLAVYSLVLIYCTLRPQTNKAYLQLLSMGDKDKVLQLFCEEIVDRKQTATNLWTTNLPIQTTHFRFWQLNIRSRVEWRNENRSL